MKKNVAIVILSIVTLSSLAYGYYQQIRAEHAMKMAEASAVIAQEAEKRAQLQQAVAKEQRRVAEEALAVARANERAAIELARAKGIK